MKRYARYDPAADSPKQILGVIETDCLSAAPGLLDITDLPGIEPQAWYDAPTERWVPAPPSVAHVWNGIKWVEDPGLASEGLAAALEAFYRRQYAAINSACEAAITAGFSSDALGPPHQYTSQLDDQLNLTGAILRGLDMPYACRDVQGVKEFRLHTAEQLRQVGDDFTLYKLQLLQHANELKQQLDAALDAGDLAALEAISWEAPQP